MSFDITLYNPGSGFDISLVAAEPQDLIVSGFENTSAFGETGVVNNSELTDEIFGIGDSYTSATGSTEGAVGIVGRLEGDFADYTTSISAFPGEGSGTILTQYLLTGATGRSKVTVVTAGRNSVLSDIEQTKEDLLDIFRACYAGRCVICTVPLKESETVGADYDTVTALNDWIRETFPDNFCEAELLAQEYPSGDDTHITREGYNVWAVRLSEVIRAQGWLNTALPNYQLPNSIDIAAASRYINVTPTDAQPDVLPDTTSEEITLAVWYKGTGSGYLWGRSHGATAADRLCLRVNGGNAFAFAGGSAFTSAAWTLDSNWHLYALRIRNSSGWKVSLWIDGIQRGSEVAVGTLGTVQNFRLAESSAGTSFQCQGKYYNPLVWNVALSDVEMADMYETGVVADLPQANNIVLALDLRIKQPAINRGVPDRTNTIDAQATNLTTSELSTDIPSFAADQTLTATAVENVSEFGTAALNLSLSATSLENTSEFGSPTLNLNLSATGYENTSEFGTAALSLNLVVPSLVNTSEFGTASITTGVTLLPAGYENTSEFGTASIRLEIIVPSVVNTSEFGSASLTAGTTLSVTSIENTSEFGNASLSLSVVVPSLVNTSEFGSASISLEINASSLVNTSEFGTASVTSGLTISATGVENTSEFGSAVVEREEILYAPSVVNTSEFGNASIALYISPSSLVNTSEFGAASVTSGVTISVTGVENTSEFGTASVTLSVIPSSVVNTSEFGNATLVQNQFLTAGSVVNISEFGNHYVLEGNNLLVTSTVNESYFGNASLEVEGQLLATAIDSVNAFGRVYISQFGLSGKYPTSVDYIKFSDQPELKTLEERIYL